MVNLNEKISSDFKKAFVNKDETSLSVLKMLKAAIEKKQKEKFYQLAKTKSDTTQKELQEKSCLNDEEILAVIASEIKKRSEALQLFNKGKRDDLAQKELKEIEILKKYLPPQLTDDQLKETIKNVIQELKISGPKDFGKVMKIVMEKVKGKAEGAKVAKLVKEFLG